MLDMGTGGAKTRTKRPASRNKARTKHQHAFVMLGLHDWPTEERVFVALGTAKEVNRLVRQAEYWHGGATCVIAKGRMAGSVATAAKRMICGDRLRGNWYALTDAVGSLLDAYTVYPTDAGSQEDALAHFASLATA